jgi:segregation and condensation protein A
MSDADAPELDLSAAEEAEGAQALILALDAYEGPLHLLLELARAKKIDLARLSVAAIADQYLGFVAAARAAAEELAGAYLVMAAWLAYLKSRLILPKLQIGDDEPDPDQLARALTLKLQRLEQARRGAAALGALPQLDADFFAFGQPRPFAVTKETAWTAELFDLLAAYCAERSRKVGRVHRPRPRRAYPLAEARRHLETLLDQLQDWRPLAATTPRPETGAEAPPPVSYLASLFGASLELARDGRIELQQSEAFAPLFLRARTRDAQTEP